MAVVAVPLFDAARPWLVPGVRAIVSYAGDEYKHERIMLWPVTKLSWVVLTPDDDMYEESVGGYLAMKLMTTKPSYPNGRLVTFSDYIDDAEFSTLVGRGRTEARRLRAAQEEELDDKACRRSTGRAVPSRCSTTRWSGASAVGSQAKVLTWACVPGRW